MKGTHLAGDWSEGQGWAFRCLKTIPDPCVFKKSIPIPFAWLQKLTGLFLHSWACLRALVFRARPKQESDLPPLDHDSHDMLRPGAENARVHPGVLWDACLSTQITTHAWLHGPEEG